MSRLRTNQHLVQASFTNDNQLMFSPGIPIHIISDWHILFFNHRNIMIGEGTYENPIVIKEQEPKFNRLIESTMVAVIETELVLLTEELDKYRDYVADYMLALDDTTLSQMTKVGNYTEAFIKGWQIWKEGHKEDAFETFRMIMSTVY